MPKRIAHTHIHLLTLGLYTLLTLLLTWPLAANLTSGVPGVAQWAFDESTFIWNIWTLKEALIDNLSSPLHSELIWYPLGIDLILYTYNFFHALLALPAALALNLAFGSNLALLVSTILSGYGTFLLVRYVVSLSRPNGQLHAQKMDVTWPAAFIAGLVYAFASNRAVYAALGHYDMVTTQWIPFYALMLLRCLDGGLSARRRYHAAAMAGLFLAMTGLAEMISALFLAIFTLIVLMLFLMRPAGLPSVAYEQSKRTRSKNRGLIALTSLAIVGAVGFLIWSPVLVPILIQFLTDDFSLKGWGEAIALSSDLLGWLTPTILHPLFGGDLVGELRRVQLRALESGVTGFRDLNTVFLGWATVALALLGALIYRSKVALWIWTTAIFGVLTLGPFLQINGRYRFDLDGVETSFPLPYTLLHYLPIIKANRAPNRNSVLLMLGLAVLVGYGFYWISSRLSRRRAGTGRNGVGARALWPVWTALGLAAMLIVGEHLTIPLPLSDARIPSVYTDIAADPQEHSILQVPLGWRNSFGVYGSERTQLQYYQSAHGKPMLGGNISRAPDFKMAYFARLPYFQALTAIEFGHEVDAALLESAAKQADELVYLYDIGYVLLHPPIEQRFPYADHWQDAWAFVKQTLPLETEPFWVENGIEAYRVLQPAGDDRFVLDLGSPGTYPYRGEGWDEAEVDDPYGASAIWATGDRSRLFVPLRNVNGAGDYLVSLTAHPFTYPGSPIQSVQLTVNGDPLPVQEVQDGWQDITWTISGDQLMNGLNRLDLNWTGAAIPREVVPGNRRIGASGVDLPIDADLKAFSDGGFMALFDDKGAQIDASAGRRGFNISILDPNNGSLITQTGFDTTANEFESRAMADFLAGIEPGMIALVVSHGDAWSHLTPEAVTGLRTLGAEISLEALDQHYVALIGVKGAEAGTAALVVDPVEAFLRVSLNRDRRPLAAAVDRLTLDPVQE